jgi:hypothetical protein
MVTLVATSILPPMLTAVAAPLPVAAMVASIVLIIAPIDHRIIRNALNYAVRHGGGVISHLLIPMVRAAKGHGGHDGYAEDGAHRFFSLQAGVVSCLRRITPLKKRPIKPLSCITLTYLFVRSGETPYTVRLE